MVSTTDRLLPTVAIFVAVCAGVPASSKEFLIVGVDSKVEFKREGIQKVKPGRDLVMIYEIGADPEEPKLVAELPLANSVFGPPTNLAITPDATLALVANSVQWEHQGGTWQAVPGTQIHVIDLTLPTPKRIGSVESDPQPSGIAISGNGKWAAIANRAGKSVTLYSIEAKKIELEDSVQVDGEAASVAFSPDGRTILATKFAQHSVAVIQNDEGQLSYDATLDLPVGRWPYNVQVANHRVALVANNGNAGLPDGHADTVSVIDISHDPPRVVKHITVGDGPEGLAVSPDGTLAVVVLLQGSAPPFERSWFYNEGGSATLLSINGKNVFRAGTVATGRFAEGVGFNKNGTHCYVADLLDNRISIFRVERGGLAATGKSVPLLGHAASLRTQAP
ncbi:YncE family protein [Bythopirellula polymerisocia]|uniref:YncE family protein n=1 Tax=Bythopirellula polymerisocia TaxID=2528003 RepID=UPI0018D2D3DA|nr:YncE family protein [Bythopirellula polymerisocia]